MGYSIGMMDEDAARRHAAAWVRRGFEGVKITDRRTGLEIQLEAESPKQEDGGTVPRSERSNIIRLG